MNMSDKKEEDEKKGLLDRLEEAVYPHERKREAAKAEEKAKAEQAEQARQRNEKVQKDFEERRRREAGQQAQAPQQTQRPAGSGAESAQSVRRHTVQSGETLSHLALKYYGSAAKDNWMKIYEANKAIIGDNPNMIKVGQELVIP
jgi:nucleoid-associated protein YgaU